MLISDSIKALREAERHKTYIDAYVREKFYLSEEYLRMKAVKSGVWCGFKEYRILSETRIEIFYEYGFSDSIYTDRFEIDLQIEIREQNIQEILSNGEDKEDGLHQDAYDSVDKV